MPPPFRAERAPECRLSDAALRRWVADLVGGREASGQLGSAGASGSEARWSCALTSSQAALVAMIRRHGVTALAHERVARGDGYPEAFVAELQAAARRTALTSLLVAAETRRILAALGDAGLPVLLLKGSALGHWLYARPELRETSDIDLLFRSRADADRAMTRLAALHYAPREASSPGDLVTFEATAVGRSGAAAGLEVDVHWRLSSWPVFAFRLSNDELWREARPLPNVAPNALGLGPVHAYLHACMHRLQNMAAGRHDHLKWLLDLHLLGRSFGAFEWDMLVDLARDRGLAGACRDGLDAAAAAFGASAPSAVTDALGDAAARESLDPGRMGDWRYVEWMNLRAFPTHRMRLRWLRQRLVPPAAYLRERYATHSPVEGLARRAMRVIARFGVRGGDATD